MDTFRDSRLFEAVTVIHALESTTKFDAIRELIERVTAFHRLRERSDFERSVLNGERLQSTGFGHGVAVAHGKSREIDRIILALGLSRQGVEYDSLDGKPVHFLFLVANPPEKQMEYLMTLSALVRVIRDQLFRQELMCCSSPEDIEHKLMNSLRGSLARLLQHS